MAMLEQCGSDGVRYWAASVRPGGDPAFDPKDPGQMKVGRRLAMKILNAARFALLQSEPRGPITEPLDRGMLTSLSLLVEECTEQLEGYDYARVLERSERFFWSFCDDYLELVKARRYGDFTPEGAASANSAMLVALSTLLRLFAPYLPFVTEEVWSWRFASGGRERSVHTSPWPTPDDFAGIALSRAGRSYDAAREVSAAIRGAKTSAKKSLRWPVARLEVRGGDRELEALRAVLADVLDAGSVDAETCRLSRGTPADGALFATTIELAESAAEG